MKDTITWEMIFIATLTRKNKTETDKVLINKRRT